MDKNPKVNGVDSEGQTHFGFESVKEEEKEGKGKPFDIELSTLRPVANDLLNDALRLDNELSALAATCSLRSVSKVQINHLGLQNPL